MVISFSLLVCVDGGAVEVVVGVTDGDMENELMIFLGSNLFFLNSPSHAKKKVQKIFAMRN